MANREPETTPVKAPAMDRRLSVSIAAVAFVGLSLAIGSYSFLGAKVSLSVMLMTTLALTNLWILAKIVSVLVPADGEPSGKSGAAWGLLGLIKLFAYFGIVYALVQRGLVDGLGLVIALVSLPVGLAIGSLVGDTAGPRSPERGRERAEPKATDHA